MYEMTLFEDEVIVRLNWYFRCKRECKNLVPRFTRI